MMKIRVIDDCKDADIYYVYINKSRDSDCDKNGSNWW
jgi:hypothetical protein